MKSRQRSTGTSRKHLPQPGLGVFLVLLLSLLPVPQMAYGKTGHFEIVSSVKNPSTGEISSQLEKVRESFQELFGYDPPHVKVIIQNTGGGTAPSSKDQSGNTPSDPPKQKGPHIISWAMNEGEALSSQSFSDLAHEITHIYFIDYMEESPGHHQSNAWLHEAVSIRAELPPYRSERKKWIYQRLEERIPLSEFFSMKNPQKENPLVKLIAELNKKLHEGKIGIEEMHTAISDYTMKNAGEMQKAGQKTMTYYSQAYSIFDFLLERHGKNYIRSLCRKLKEGSNMKKIVESTPDYPGGINELEEKWVSWVKKGGPS